MKTFKLIISVFLLAFLTCSISVHAQTHQYELRASFDEGILLCDKVCKGYWVYHITYHLNKDGELSRLHWNMKDCDIRDVETGEKYIMTNTGSDNLGAMWGLFNMLNEYNNVLYDFRVSYDQPDGWMDDFLPETFPVEGTYVEMNLKMIGKKGIIGYGKFLVQAHINANGELSAYVEKAEFTCN